MINIISKKTFRSQSYHGNTHFFSIQRNFVITINVWLGRFLELNEGDYLMFANDNQEVYIGKVPFSKINTEEHFVVLNKVNKLLISNLGLVRYLMNVTNTKNDTGLRFFVDVKKFIEIDGVKLYGVSNIINIKDARKGSNEKD